MRRQIAPNRLKQFFLRLRLTVDRKHAGTTGITNEISQNSFRLGSATDSSDVSDVKFNDVVGLSANSLTLSSTYLASLISVCLLLSFVSNIAAGGTISSG